MKETQKLTFDEFASYAMSASFTPKEENAKLVEQANRLQPYFVKNLEDNR